MRQPRVARDDLYRIRHIPLRPYFYRARPPRRGHALPDGEPQQHRSGRAGGVRRHHLVRPAVRRHRIASDTYLIERGRVRQRGDAEPDHPPEQRDSRHADSLRQPGVGRHDLLQQHRRPDGILHQCLRLRQHRDAKPDHHVMQQCRAHRGVRQPRVARDDLYRIWHIPL